MATTRSNTYAMRGISAKDPSVIICPTKTTTIMELTPSIPTTGIRQRVRGDGNSAPTTMGMATTLTPTDIQMRNRP